MPAFDRSRLLCPTSLLVIPPVPIPSTSAFRPAYSMMGLVPGSLIVAGSGPAGTPIGSTPPHDETTETIVMANGPPSNFIMTSETEPSAMGNHVTFRSLAHGFSAIIHRERKMRTLADLVSLDKDINITFTKFGNTADMRAGDVIVTFKQQIRGGSGTICVDDIDTVVLALPPFTTEEYAEALVGHHSRNVLAAIYTRIVENLQCWNYSSSGGTPTSIMLVKSRYEVYEAKESGLKHLEGILLKERSVKKRWWCEIGEVMEEEVTKKRVKVSPV